MTKKILIVEDNLIIAEDIKSLLSSFGYIVVAIVDKASSAIAILKRETIDLIIIDIVIKGDLSGIDLAEIIATNYKIPFIYLTSNSDKATIEKAIQHQPKAYIVKPFNEIDIFTNIRLAMAINKGAEAKKIVTSLMFNIDGQFVKITMTDFLFAQSKGNYLTITTTTKKYITRMSCKELLHVGSDFSFFQIHKSYIVNPINILSYNLNSVSVKGFKLPLGRAYKLAFMAMMNK